MVQTEFQVDLIFNFSFIKCVDKGQISTLKDLES